jgi:RNA-splicing ligase RtcB
MRLRSLKAKTKLVTTTKAGKQVMSSAYAGRGMLTDAVIDKLMQHFGQNIRKYAATVDIDVLRKYVMLTYYHSSSMDANPKHQCCPLGDDSWCWVRRAGAADEVPALHSTKDLWLANVLQALLFDIMKIYVNLAT